MNEHQNDNYSMLVWHDASVKPPIPSKILINYMETGWRLAELENDLQHAHLKLTIGDAWRWASLVTPTSTTPVHPLSPEPAKSLQELAAEARRSPAYEHQMKKLIDDDDNQFRRDLVKAMIHGRHEFNQTLGWIIDRADAILTELKKRESAK